MMAGCCRALQGAHPGSRRAQGVAAAAPGWPRSPAGGIALSPLLALARGLVLSLSLSLWRSLVLRAIVASVLGAAAMALAAAAPPPGPAVLGHGSDGSPVPVPPQRIVSLLPSLTETVCALGACDRLVGTDRYSNWPASVLALPKLGGLDDTQIERIVALRPDLVLAEPSTRALDRLRALGLPVLALGPQSWAQTREAITVLATALGRAAAGPELLARIDARVAAAAARVPQRWHHASVYFEVASEPYAAGPASFVGELLTRLHLVNIVPAEMGAFVQINPEFVLRAQPALIMSSRHELGAMPQRPGWGGLHALQGGEVCGFDGPAFDALVRPGPRLGEGAEAIADCLAVLATIKP